MFDKQENLIEQYISYGQFQEAFDEINSIEKKRPLLENEIFQRYYVKIFLNLDKGEFQEGWDLADEMIEETHRKNKKLYELDAIIGKIENGICLSKFEECFELIQKAEYIINSLDNISKKELKLRKGYLTFLKGRIYQETHEVFKALEFYQKSYKIRKEIGEKSGLLWSLLNWGIVANFIGEFQEAEKCHKQSLEIAEELNNELGIIWNLISLGWISYHLRDLKLAFYYAKKVLSISKLNEFKYILTYCYDLLGYCYILEGNLQTALDYFQKSLIVRLEEGYTHFLAQSYYNIGLIYSQKGELKESLYYFNKGLKTLNVKDDFIFKPTYLIAMGKVYGELGDYPTAKKYLIEAVDLLNKKNIVLYHFLPFHVSFAKAFHYLIVLSINNNDKENIDNYLTQLHNLNKKYERLKLTDQLYRLDKAIILISSGHLIEIMKAGTILEDIMNEKIIDHDIVIEAMINQCDVLLKELEMTGNDEILDELTEISERLLQISQSQYLYDLYSESYLLKAKISLLNLDIDNARLSLTKAQKIANKYDLKLLASKISNEHDSLLQNLDEWEEKAKLNIPLQERLKDSRYEFLFSKMIRSKIEELPSEKEIPIYFVILNSYDGQCLYEKMFEDIQIMDGNLIAGFISAINFYGKEAFSSSGSIDRIKHGDYLIILNSIENFIFGYVFKGNSFSAINKMNKTIETLQLFNSTFEDLNKSIQTHLEISEETKSFIDKKIQEIFLL